MRSVLAVSLVLCSLAGTARAAAPGAGSPTVDEIVAKYVAARGGADRLAAIQSLRLTGKVRFGSTEAPVGRVLKRPGLMRGEFTLQGLTAVEAYDGKEGWAMQPFGGRRDAEKRSAEDAKESAQDADIEGPLVNWRQKGHRVEYLGTENVGGTEALKLRVELKDGDTKTIYLDPDYYLEIRVETTSRVRGAERTSVTEYGSYEQVAGVWIPFSMDTGPKGRPPGQRLVIETAEANVEVDDAIFRFPAAGTPVLGVIKAGPNPVVPGSSTAPAPVGERTAVVDSAVVSGLGARNIGSAAMSGRVAAVAARNEGGKTTVFIGAASGGVWKSQDGGTTFKPVFDEQPVQSIGAITLDPSNPKIVWVGTGEAWTRNSVSIGNGIYKSTDGGDTWTNMGLPESEHIVRILVHPKQSDTVYACVPGKLWSDSADRGVYKTVDGGKTWTQVLKGSNLSTGCSGLTLDPGDPEALLAGMWDFRRKGWTFRSGGDGPKAASGSGLFRSADGGKTWTELTTATNAGLPPKPWGRVEVVFAPSDRNVVYTLIESTKSGLFRSSDGGKTWEARDRSQWMVWRPFYFARLVVDPTNPDRLYKPNLDLIVSEDGGKSFSSSGGGAHGDWHDVWIDPDNTKHVLGGDDGGFWISFDGGNRWWKTGNLPISQFYHVSVDDRDPYQVYGGLQDNSSWVGDSAYPGGITNDRWQNLYGGDGFWTVPDPTDPDAVYAEAQGGYIGRVDRKTMTGRDIQPKAGYGEKLRFNWNTPIATSPTQKETLYIGAQFLFRSRDRGYNWERISPDLSTNDPEKQKQEQSGGVTVDNSSAEMHTTIYSISESPLDANVIWVGTDDGNVQLSRDAGKTWTNVVGNVKGLPKASWVSWVEASRFDGGTAYAAFDRHTFGDMNPWVYRTTDFGKTWQRIVSPEQGVHGYAHVVKEDAVERNLLFVGTELGLWISADGGATWAEFKGSGNFPSVAVREVRVHPREHDLVIATHGRGIWIIDDLTPLRNLGGEVLSKAAAFLPSRPIQQRMPANGGWVDGDAVFVGQNPPGGATIGYYQRTRHLFGPIKLEILDAEGKVVDTLSPNKARGINRMFWPMTVKPPRVPRAAQVAGAGFQGPRVPPGTYKVRLTKGGQSIESKLEIGIDRRAPYDAAERKAQFDAAMKAHALFGEMSDLVGRIDGLRAAVDERAKALGKDPLAAKLTSLGEAIDAVKRKIVATKEGGDITGEERIREHLDIVYGAILNWEGRPTSYQVERVEVLGRELGDVAKELDKLIAEKVRPLDAELVKHKLEPLLPPAGK